MKGEDRLGRNERGLYVNKVKGTFWEKPIWKGITCIVDVNGVNGKEGQLIVAYKLAESAGGQLGWCRRQMGLTGHFLNKLNIRQKRYKMLAESEWHHDMSQKGKSLIFSIQIPKEPVSVWTS